MIKILWDNKRFRRIGSESDYVVTGEEMAMATRILIRTREKLDYSLFVYPITRDCHPPCFY